jgi:hypothetical protein
LLIALSLLVAAVAIAMIPRRHYENHRLTDENFKRIANGMTQAEVEEILGPATSVETYGNYGSKMTWESRKISTHRVFTRVIGIGFDGNGRSCTTPYEGNTHVSEDWWLRFRGFSPGLAKQLDDWLPR